MAKNKWRAREYTPAGNMTGSHSFYAEAVIDNEIDNRGLAAKIAARTGFKAYEVQAVVAAIADIVYEEVLESNRVTLSDEQGLRMVTIYPKVSGSVSDADVLAETTAQHAQDPSKPVRTVAQESDLTSDRLTWTMGATVGIKFSKKFALQKQAQKVKFVATDTAIPNDDVTGDGGGSGSGTGGGSESGSGSGNGSGSGTGSGSGNGGDTPGGGDGSGSSYE